MHSLDSGTDSGFSYPPEVIPEHFGREIADPEVAVLSEQPGHILGDDRYCLGLDIFEAWPPRERFIEQSQLTGGLGLGIVLGGQFFPPGLRSARSGVAEVPQTQRVTRAERRW